eukprot:PITA_07850
MNLHGRGSAYSLFIAQIIIFVPVLIFTLNGQICHGEMPELPTHTCNNSSSYAEGSTFESNLILLFQSLVQGANQSGFKISSYGQGPDQVYGLLQCREDITVDQCYTCWELATTNLQQNCSKFRGGSIWPFHCFLRYEDYNFTGILDTELGSIFPESGVLAGVFLPTDFQIAAENLLRNLSGAAAPEKKKSALGTTVDSSQTIYGLVQCTRDISSHSCTRCLTYAIDKIFTSYSGNQGVQYWSQSCIVRHEIYLFFNMTALSLTPAERPVNTPPKQITPSSNTPPKQITPSSNTPAEGPANTPPKVNRPSSTSGQIKHSSKTPIILGVAGGFFLVLIVCAFATWKTLKCAIVRRGYEDDEQLEEGTLIGHDRQIIFTMGTLVAATKNFHDDNKLGQGGFGPVYKGITPDGKEIAVKKLSLRSTQGRKEFMNEVKFLAKVQHRNLVNLLGCCAEGSERLLVYEYLPNKSLDKILFDPTKRNQLDWPKRYNIIMGVARGLLYIHQDSPLRIIHRDIKASNVLLDREINPKIADFGLARLFPEEETHVSTRVVAGTYGYMPPEYAMQGQLSAKTDVYSFGVLLLEVIAGRKSIDYNLSPEIQVLLRWVWRSFVEGNVAGIIDPTIIETWDEAQVLRCIHVALLCTQAEPSLRPSMFTAILMLSSDSATFLPDPTIPAFVTSRDSQNTESSRSGSGLSHASANTSSSATAHSPLPSVRTARAPASNADASITELVPR